MNTRALGGEAESLAATFLQNLGWQILARNAHYRFGEIDILADAGDSIVIVEVKAKRSQHQGLAVEMVTPRKQQTLRRLANWLQTEYNKPVRVDVVAIDGYATQHPILTHYPNAIEDQL